MDEKKLQSNYTALYLKYSNLHDLPFSTDEIITPTTKHSFDFFNNYINLSISNSEHTSTFDSLFTFKKSLESKTNNAYFCFDLELSILNQNKSRYLNKTVNELFQILGHINEKENQIIKDQNAVVSSLIMDVLSKISNSPNHLHLNSTNRKKLSKWFYMTEPILSFELKQIPEDKWFESMYNKYLRNFIRPEDNQFETFKYLFLGRHLENRIIWSDRKSSLYYFITLLINSNLIKDTKNKHWLITSEFFLIKTETIRPSDLVNQKSTTNKAKRKKLEGFINALTHNNS